MKKPKHNFKKYNKEERKRLGMDKVPDTMYDPRELSQDLRSTPREEIPVNYDGEEEV